ncbi:MAG: DNA pilot protein [Microviridae sp.]|nr:MAG: DNA pilot protein [Microviridae sp.]
MGFSMGDLGAIVGGTSTMGLGTALSMGGQIYATETNKREAAKNRDFQSQMSETAHQREVKDLRLAGLNPILSATHGGASTPSGSVSAPAENPVTPAINSAMSIVRTLAETAKTQAETVTELNRPELINLQGASARAQSNLYTEQANYYADQQEYSQALTDLTKQNKISEQLKQVLLKQDSVIAQQAIAAAKSESKIDNTTYGYLMRLLDRFTKSASPLIPKTSAVLGPRRAPQ